MPTALPERAGLLLPYTSSVKTKEALPTPTPVSLRRMLASPTGSASRVGVRYLEQRLQILFHPVLPPVVVSALLAPRMAMESFPRQP